MSGTANLRTVKEAAAFLGFSLRKTHRLVEDGTLPSIRLGKLFVPDLEDWLQTHTRQTPPPEPLPAAVTAVPNSVADLMPRERRFGKKGHAA